MAAKDPIHILLVEDYESHAEIIKRHLEQSEYSLSLARTLDEARSILAEREPSLAVIDWNLPDGTAIRLLPGNSAKGRYPCVVMTSYGDEKTAVEAMKAGAYDYFAKSEEAFALVPHLVERTLREWNVRVEKRKAEEALRRSNQKFRAVFHTTTDFVCIKDLNLRFREVNPALAEAFGRTPEQMIGLTSRDLHDEEDAQKIENWDRRVLKGETIEGRQSRKVNGERRTFVDVRAPMINEDGEVEEIFVVSRDVTGLSEASGNGPSTSSSATVSSAMKQTMELAEAAARGSGTVLLQGESGTGKDWLAKWIHDHSPRSGSHYFSINCAALTESLAESELFGHEKGAFTGSAGLKKGLVELAEGGTLMLNEIGELPLNLQAKLLTFLDTQKFLRVGGEKQRQADVRVIASTHRKLADEVAEGRFMRPLFYRLAVLEIHIPPLRERTEDFPALVGALLEELCERLGILEIPELRQGFIEELEAYRWPGNVRELRNVLERSLILSGGGPLALDSPRTARARSDKAGYLTVPLNVSLAEAKDLVIRSLCAEELRRNRGNRKETAQRLGISRDALYRYMRKFDIDKKS